MTLSSFSLIAQYNDSSIILKDVEINEPKIKQVEPRYSLDSLSQLALGGQSITQRLRYATPAIIHQAVPGQQASIRLRGLSSTHTQVYWEGMRLNNGALGQVDASSLYFDENFDTEFYTPDQSLAFGNGALGGAINFSLKNNNATNTLIDSRYNSIRAYSFHLGQFLKSEKSNTYLSGSYNHNENHYDFVNIEKLGHPTETLNNANSININTKALTKRKLNSSLDLFAGLNFTHQDRQIPLNVIAKPSSLEDINTNINALIGLTKSLGKHGISFKAINTYNHYIITNPNENLFDTLNGHSGSILAEHTYTHGNIHTKTGYMLNVNTLSTSSRPNLSQFIHELFQQTSFSKERYSIAWQNRLSWLRGQNVSPQSSLLGSFIPIQNCSNLKVNGSLSALSHIVTLNEAYWSQKNLENEHSLQASVGFDYLLTKKQSEIEFSSQYYHLVVDNFVQWRPRLGNSIPINLKQVKGEGIESRIKARTQLNEITLSTNLAYQYAFIGISEALSNEENTLNKQLAYQPKHRFQGLLSANWKGLTFLVEQMINSERPLANDHSIAPLPEVYITNMSVYKDWALNKGLITTGFVINNVWDYHWRAVNFFPMPGRNYEVVFRYRLGA